jgi:hypothetical protein
MVVVASALVAAGCEQSRQAKLEKRGEAVRASLVKERDRVLALPSTSPERAGRLAHLEGLHHTLSAANIGLGTMPVFLDEQQRGVGYDVIEEVFATIEWNTPLGPGDAMRPLPAGFANNTLRLDGGAGTPQGASPVRTQPLVPSGAAGGK